MSQKLNTPSNFGWILIGILAITPLISINQTLPLLLPRVVLWSVITALGAVALIRIANDKQSLPYPNLLWIGVFLWLFLGYSNALSLPEWWLTVSRYGLYASVMLISTALYQKNKLTFHDLSRGLVLMGLFGSVIALANLNMADDVYEAIKPFGHKNFTSAALLISLLGSLSVIREGNKFWRPLAIISVALSTIAVVLLRSRGVWIGAIASSIFLLLAIEVFRPKGSKKTVVPLKYLGLGFGVLLMGIIAVFSIQDNGSKILDAANIDFRFTYWGHSIEMFQENPVTGVGAGQWKIHFPEHGLDHTNTRVSNGETAVLRPHNDYLWMLAEGGFPAFILYVGFWASVLFISIKKLYKEEDLTKRMDIMSSASMVVAFLVYAMGEFPIERADFAVPVFIAASLLISDSKGIITPKKSLGIAAAALAILSLYIAYGRYSNMDNVENINKGNDRQDVALIINSFEDTDLGKVDMDEFANPLPYFYGLATMAKAQQTQNPQLMNKAKESFEEALTIHPWHVVTHVSYGNWYKINGQLDEAMEIYQRGLAISPFNISLRLNRAEIYLMQDNPDQCIRVLLSFVGNENDPKYQRLTVSSLRASTGQGQEPVVNDFILQTEIESLDDRQLFMAFLRYRDRIRTLE